MAPVIRSQFLENINEKTLTVLYNCNDCEPEVKKELATLTATTAWVESGYSHAREYNLDFVMQVNTP